MSLDATVWCDCFEKGKLREPPPPGVLLRVEPSGFLTFNDAELPVETEIAMDQWRERRACKHPGCRLLHHRLGNIALIALLRSELKHEADRYPIICGKVLYSGIHAGDYLPLDTIPGLQRELDQLRDFKCSGEEANKFMIAFHAQMCELVGAALSVSKPIDF